MDTHKFEVIVSEGLTEHYKALHGKFLTVREVSEAVGLTANMKGSNPVTVTVDTVNLKIYVKQLLFS